MYSSGHLIGSFQNLSLFAELFTSLVWGCGVWLFLFVCFVWFF